jgi:D-serine deaminase-like pyridoxal phosphate-dependent protein
MLRSDLKTPALLVDMIVLESNLRKMASFFKGRPARLRPHYKNHRSVAIAKRQIELGAIGMSCATLGEAEALVNAGIDNIFIVNEIAAVAKVEYFAELARRADVMIAVDNPQNIAALSSIFARLKVKPSVVVDVDTGLGRCGVTPGEPALALAQMACARGLRLRGLSGYEGHCMRLPQGKDKICAIQQAMHKLVSTADLLRSRGLPVEIVSAGGTGTYSISGKFPGVTEIQAGSYPLMDTDYRTVCPDFDLALSVLGTVISRTANERLILDIGKKEISAENGLPVFKNLAGAELRRLDAEHAIVDIVDPHLPVQVGDQVEVWAHYGDGTVNLHRQMFGIRDGRVEETFLLEH